MCWNKRIHEGLKVGPPPLGKTLADFPISSFLALAYATDRGKSFVESKLEAFFFTILMPELLAAKLEKGIRDLEHQNVRVIVLMANEDALAGATHAMVGKVLLEAFQTGDDGRIFFGLRFLDTECVVG